MSRGLATAFKAALGETVLHPAIFAEFQFDSGTARFWTGETSINWDGHTWIGGGLIGGIETGGEGDALQARRMTFTLNGVDRTYYATAVATQYRGRPARVWFALTNAAGTSVLYHYLLEESRMDTLVIQEGADSITLVLTCETRLVDLFTANAVYLNSQEYHKTHPGDDFYMYTPILPNIQMPWGLPANYAAGSSSGDTDAGGNFGGGQIIGRP